MYYYFLSYNYLIIIFIIQLIWIARIKGFYLNLLNTSEICGMISAFEDKLTEKEKRNENLNVILLMNSFYYFYKQLTSMTRR